MDKMRQSNVDTISSEPEAPGTSQPSVAYSQPGTMNYSGPGASSGIVNNPQNIAVYDTGRISTGDTINSVAAGTVQQSTIIIHGSFINHGDRPNIGGIANQPNEENKGAQASSSSMDMKLYYSTTFCKASPLPWYPEYTWDIDEVYTELALQKSATSKFGVEGLFEQWHKHNRKGGTYRILIEGDAGYGKSTLMLKIASDWSKSDSNDYTSRFSLLFVVKLGRVGEDGNLLSYMESFYKEKMDTPLKNVLKSKKAEVLVLLDGYDEANLNSKEEVDRIMKKETMSHCHVVLTSRCGHVPDDVKANPALLVRVTGFGERQVAVAVGKFFIKAGHLTKAEVISYRDKPVPRRESDPENERDDSDFDSDLNDAILPSIDDFKNVQEKDPLDPLPVDQRLSLEQFHKFMWKLRAGSPYKELAQCPLLCVMMCCLVSECPNGELPSTVSSLYFAMINRNLYRAARKKAAGKVRNLSILQDRITKGHEGYLQDFGSLCINGLKTRSMSFTLFEITGNEEEAETTDVKVTQLIEAGVLVQDTNERNPRYQVPHRTTAEFLAAYCLSREKDKNLCQQNLLDLYRLEASFDGVAASLIEMGKTSCLADAFRGIKFPSDCLTRFMKSYFTQRGAAGTWMEFKDALPNKLTMANTSERVTVSSAKPNQTLLHLCEVLGKGNTRETNAPSSDCRVSVHVKGDFNPELLQTLSKSGVRLERLDLQLELHALPSDEKRRHTYSETARILQELLKSHSYPVQLSFYYKIKASPLPWYPEYTWDIDEVYTELALQESATSKFGVEGLFEQWHKHNPKGGSYRILIEGDAGYGKSTLMLKIASDWSKSVPNDYTSRFSLLLVVKLGYVGEDGNLLSSTEEFYKEQMDTPLRNVLKSKGAEVLVLLDGYDEANAKTKKEVDRIMKRETMNNFHVVLTSRFGHVPDDVKGYPALPVRVKGFGERQVAVAVGKFFIKAGHLNKYEVISCMDKLRKDETEWTWMVRMSADLPNSVNDFKNVQEKDPLDLLPADERLSLEQCKQFMWTLLTESPYKELAQCPLLCVMMCCLLSECPNGKLPSTVSGLYFAMINRNLYRAAIKKPRPARKFEEQWNWDELDNRIQEGHDNYLQEFGRLCVEGLKTRSMSFTLFDITGQKRAKTTDVKVTRLIVAGVLFQDTNDRNPRYQVPHRTTAEFLAAYCLSRENDQNLCQQNLRDLFRLQSSFDGVAASLIEMGKARCLADAFCDIKFPGDCLTRFMKSYFFEHGAAVTWKEFKDALPNKLTMANTSERVTVSSAEPNQNLLHLCEGLGKGNTRETNARPLDCHVSVRVEGDFNPELLQTLSKSDVRLERLDLRPHIGAWRSDAEIRRTKSEIARILQELLKSDSCPVQLSFRYQTKGFVLALTEAMQEVPEDCRLKSFDFFPDWGEDISLLLEVLAGKWLFNLQHLGLKFCKPKPIFKRLREPGCSLTSLHLSFCELHIENLMMLAKKLETLSLSCVQLDFDVTEISKYAVKERCSLKSLRLMGVSLFLKGSLPSVDENPELLLAWRNVALHLEELVIDNCYFPVELFSWLNLSLPNLRTVTIGKIGGKTPSGDKQFYANQVLEALTRSSGDSIEELSLLKGFWESDEILKLHPIREALQRCPRMKSVNLGYYSGMSISAASIGPGPSTPLSPSDEEALKSDNIYCALFKIVLSVPKLQTLTSHRYLFDKWEVIGTFHAIADKAKKWPGKTNDNDCNTSLTLHRLHNVDAVNAMHVFRERGLEYRLRYVTEDVYEFCFPPRVNTVSSV